MEEVGDLPAPLLLQLCNSRLKILNLALGPVSCNALLDRLVASQREPRGKYQNGR